MGRRYVYVSAEVDAREVLGDIDSDLLVEELQSRNLEPAAPSFDLLSEIRWHLLHAGVQAALAMIESEMEKQRIPEERRQKQSQAAARMQ